MKLRIRSQQTKQTLKLEIPNACTFHVFKQIILHQISSSQSPSHSSSDPRCVSVTLNNKDELFGAPNDSLQSLGITSGDLVFYSYNPRLLADELILGETETLTVPVRELEETSKSYAGLVEFRDPTTLGIELERGSNDIGDLDTLETGKGLALSLREIGEKAKTSDVGLIECRDPGTLGIEIGSESLRLLKFEGGRVDLGELETLDSGKTVMESEIVDMAEDEADVNHSETLDLDTEHEEMMEGDCMEKGTGSGSDIVEKFSVPCFLRKVLKDELSDSGSAHRLLLIALHAVLLDSGFVQFDSMSNRKVDSFRVPEDWPSISLWYTLPILIVNGSDIIESVVLKVQSLGRNTIVHGSLTRNGLQVHTIRLKEDRFAPTFDLIWATNSDSINKTSDSKPYSEIEVFEFWKAVKDGLALPLLIDLCDKAGCELPPCLMQLPTDLKLMILDLLPGVDLAKVACVCSELLYLSSSDDLWKQKYEEEFGDVQMCTHCVTRLWKSRFAQTWVIRKRPMIVPQIRPAYPRPARRHFVPPGIFPPEPFGAPRIIGGDYDIWPGVGVPHRFRSISSPAMPRLGAQLICSSNCNSGRRLSRQ